MSTKLWKTSRIKSVAIYKSGSNWGVSSASLSTIWKLGWCATSLEFLEALALFIFPCKKRHHAGFVPIFFFQQGVFGKAFAVSGFTVRWKFSASVIETAAGYILGASILFPKTYSRMNSFKIGFKNSFKIFLSTVPFTIAAGFLEGFITRYSIGVPNWWAVSSSCLPWPSFLFITWFILLLFTKKHLNPNVRTLQKARFKRQFLRHDCFFQNFWKNIISKTTSSSTAYSWWCCRLDLFHFQNIYRSFLGNIKCPKQPQLPDGYFNNNMALIVGGFIITFLLIVILSMLNISYPIIYLKLVEKTIMLFNAGMQFWTQRQYRKNDRVLVGMYVRHTTTGLDCFWRACFFFVWYSSGFRWLLL